MVGLRPAATVLAVAGAVWWGVAVGPVVAAASGTTSWSVAWVVLWVVAGVVVGALVLVAARRRLSSDGAHEAMAANRRLYAVVNTAQALGILAVVVGAGRAGVPAWIPVGITAVFGVHFLPFARAFRWRGYVRLALALLLVAAAGAVMAATGSPASAVHGVLGPVVAVVLWGTVLAAARAGRPGCPPAPDVRSAWSRPRSTSGAPARAGRPGGPCRPASGPVPREPMHRGHPRRARRRDGHRGRARCWSG